MLNEYFERPYTPATLGLVNFIIPLYQRPYAWEDSQVEQLLKDLHAAFVNAPQSFYHIGILSVAGTDDHRYDMIDGQQRMTTLMLIGKAARGYWPEWKKFLTSSRLDLYGREDDKAFLDGDNTSQPGLHCNPRMIVAVRVAEKFFERCDNKESFARFVYERASFFLSCVPSGYKLIDKNLQFVRMNNRGKQLEKHEILKVMLLSKLSFEEQGRMFKTWNLMLDCLTGIKGTDNSGSTTLEQILGEAPSEEKEDVPGREPLYSAIVTVPEFLLIALARHRVNCCGEEPSFDPDKLIETFGCIEIDSSAIRCFMVVLENQVDLLKSFFIFSDKRGQYSLGVDADTEDSTFFFEDVKKKSLIAIQSFLHVSTEPHHWLIPALNWCEGWKREHRGNTIDAALFVEELESIDNSLIPGDVIGAAPVAGKRFLSQLLEVKNMTYGNVSRYWFYRLDYELLKLWDQKGQTSQDSIWWGLSNNYTAKHPVKNLLDTFVFRRCGSVEHMRPQHQIESGEPVDHSFGNLSLISTNRNSKFSNNPLDGKKEIIQSSGYTESLKMLNFLYCCGPVRDTAVEGEKMFRILADSVTAGKSARAI